MKPRCYRVCGFLIPSSKGELLLFEPLDDALFSWIGDCSLDCLFPVTKDSDLCIKLKWQLLDPGKNCFFVQPIRNCLSFVTEMEFLVWEFILVNSNVSENPRLMVYLQVWANIPHHWSTALSQSLYPTLEYSLAFLFFPVECFLSMRRTGLPHLNQPLPEQKNPTPFPLPWTVHVFLT